MGLVDLACRWCGGCCMVVGVLWVVYIGGGSGGESVVCDRGEEEQWLWKERHE